MAPRAVLPSADAFFEKVCLTSPDRPPWSAVGSVELARLLGVHMQSIYNWRCRGTGPEPEAEPRRHYRRVGQRSLYKVSAVLQWLDAEGRTDWHWTGRFLAASAGYDADDLADQQGMLDWIALSERGRWFPAVRWRWRSVERGIERLRRDYGF